MGAYCIKGSRIIGAAASQSRHPPLVIRGNETRNHKKLLVRIRVKHGLDIRICLIHVYDDMASVAVCKDYRP